MIKVMVEVIRLDDAYYVRNPDGPGSTPLTKREVVELLALQDAYEKEENSAAEA